MIVPRVSRLVRTLVHHRVVQVGGRLVAPLRRRLTALGLPDSAPVGTARPVASGHPQHDPWNEASALLAGDFRFLGRSRSLGWPPDWRASGASLLWRFNLHYHHYLHLLPPAARQELVHHWIATNRDPNGVGWHPYVSSLRIASWCRTLTGAGEHVDSLWKQATYLRRNLETHVLGNHLLENARALILAAEFFGREGAARDWSRVGYDVVMGQLEEQILPDGGHFERSPMYHALMLGLLTEVLSLAAADEPGRADLEDAVRRMSDFLVSVVHPDGDIALLNDATREIAPPVPALEAYAREVTGYEAQRRSTFRDSGYYIVHGETLYVILDGGPIGPDYLPAHSHADVFTYEMSVRDKRIVVDTGVASYETGHARARDRGTAAHNTATVDGRDQAEVWGAFRVARRYAPTGVTFLRTETGATFSGQFSGYAHLLGDGLVHRRNVTIEDRGGDLRVEDRLAGTGRHAFESLIHLHPEVEVEMGEAGAGLRMGSVALRLSVEAGAISTRPAVYCPNFGVELPSTVLVVSADGAPARLAYRLTVVDS